MKTAELTTIGLTEEQATQVLAMNGKDIENAKATNADKWLSRSSDELDGITCWLKQPSESLTKYSTLRIRWPRAPLNLGAATAQKVVKTHIKFTIICLQTLAFTSSIGYTIGKGA